MSEIPSLGNSPTKESIIEILSKEWPMTAKKIYNRLHKEFKISVTYQATHKALKELIEKKVIEKSKDGYQINIEWIKNLGQFSQKIKSKIENLNIIKESAGIQKIKYQKHEDFIKSHIEFLEELSKKDSTINLTFHFRHVPYPHVLSREDLEKLKPLMPKLKWTIYAHGNTPLDNWCANNWRKWGIEVITGAEIATNTMIIITNDYVTYIYMPKNSIDFWDKIFSIKDISEADMHTMTETLINQKFKTIAVTIKDKEIAKTLTES